MANKLQQFNDLFSDTLLHITSDTDAWVGYLRSISRHYKYTFSDVLLIYAQRPNASACATMETWNKWGRWVNAGARGIALLDTSDASRLRLRYVFDVSDTNSQRGIAPRTWEFTPDTYPAVTETLANAYQVEIKDRAMPDIVADAAEVLTIDNGNDYLRLLTGNMAGSRLDGLSESDRDITFLRAVYASVAAAMLFRGGWESEAIKKVDEQKDLLLMFNTKDTASLLCGAVCDIAEMGLREIESTVRAEQKKKIRTFANSRQMRDNGPKEETQPQERSQNHGTDVHEEGRLPAARPDAGRDAEAGQVRTNAPAIPQNGEAAVVRDAAGERTVGAASGGGAEAGDGAGEAVGGAHGRETERDRGTESPRPDGVGGPDEQHPAQRRGEREGGPDLYLNRYFDQLEHQPPADPQKLRSILAHTDSLNTKAGDILDYLTAHPDPMDRADYIRGVFNDVYTELNLPVWGRVGYKRFDRGLEVWDGAYGAEKGHALVPWSDVAEQMWQMLTGVEVEQTTADSPQLSTLEQQVEAIEQAGAEKVPALSYSQEQIDKAILSGSHFAGGKLRIYEQFQKHLSIDENIAFLKKVYGIGAVSGNKDYPDISFNDKGLYIGSSLWSRDALYLSWKKVAKRISALIEAGRYLTDEEKAEYAKYRAGKTQDKPEQTYRYHLGDTVYIGKDEYTISGIGDPMRLHDETFPLVDTEMPRAEFERKVRENPRNDHLLGAGETEQAAPDEADDFSDIDPAAIRAELAKRGIVDGQVVDKAANDASPFISQVMQDVQRLAEEENPVPDISKHPVTREGDTITIGDGPATHEVTVALPDEEWEQVKEAVPETGVREQSQPDYTVETVAFYSGEKSGMPFDVAIEKLHTEEPDRSQPTPPSVPAQNYRITDDNLGHGGAKAKYAANIAAIQTLRTVENEHRNATPEEQELLSRYVGWGGVADAFDPEKPAWAKEYQELKDLLTPDEYNSARSSTLNAHYTSPTVIRAMYQALENMGFRTGNILDKTTPRLIQFHTLKNAVEPPFLGGFFISSISAG